MLLRLAHRMLTETRPRLLWRFACTFGLKGLWAMERFRRRSRRGEPFPPFLFLSVTNRCNLRCQGCWAVPDGPGRSMPPELLDRILRQAKRRGGRFFGILGGEPLLYGPLWDVLRRHGDCYFQVFTNGTLLTGDAAAAMRRLGNVTPLVSIEGLEGTSDVRRGGRNVYARALEGLDHCRCQGLITGVASSLCRSNFEELASDSFLRDLVSRGVHYAWYYIYRPAGPDPRPDLALSGEQVAALRRFLVQARTRRPILLVDAYWDDRGRALCPAAAGISHHVNPDGYVEPCPPIQFAEDRIADGRDLFHLIRDSEFLREFRALAARTTRGCILLERPDLLAEFVRRRGARDTTGRGRGLEELAAMTPCASHHQPGQELPERSWAYRLAKRRWFFGFGAYG